MEKGPANVRTASFFPDQTRCNVWILDGDLYHKGLLKFAVSAESLQETLVVFAADMSRPWTIMESLQKWASVLREHIDKLKLPPEEIRDMEQKCKLCENEIALYFHASEAPARGIFFHCFVCMREQEWVNECEQV